ncbi:MAG: hypothetical protein ACYDC6_01215, partial [Acidobacteriaceae bacterium]
MTDPSGSSCIGINTGLQAHLVLEESGVVLILLSVHVETNNPGPSGEASKSVRIGSQTGQANFQLLDDCIQV